MTDSTTKSSTPEFVPKLIALDLDGTLLNEAGRVTDDAVSAIARVTRAGHRVVLATGRPPEMAFPVTTMLAGFVTHIVGGNGSIISTFPETPDGDPELVHLVGFALTDAMDIVRHLRSVDSGFGFALASDAGFAHEPGFAELMPAAVHNNSVADVTTIGGTTAFKLLAFHRTKSVHNLLNRLPTLIEELLLAEAAGFAVSHLGADAVEIGPAEADKCTGLQWLCTDLGVPQADVIAVGDEWNDLTMLEWAGRGVAMGNADQRVQAAANETIGANTDEGIADFLNSLLD
jgi:Cof subfamily protein (haloacid dehalogenase superfamily)